MLRELSFFKRLSPKIIEKSLPSFRVKQISEGDLIFVEDEVAIILNGRIKLRLHEESALNFKTVGIYKEGQILGFEAGDNKFTKNCNLWYICCSKSASVLFINTKDFAKLWEYTKIRDNEI